MKYIMEGQEPEKELVGIVSLDVKGGRPWLYVKDEEGRNWCIVVLNEDGTLHLSGNVRCPGIQTDSKGRIKISK